MKSQILLCSVFALSLGMGASSFAQYPSRLKPLGPEEEAIGNPQVKPRKIPFSEVNSSHKLAVAIWGSGLDYNQPYLFNNIHFDTSVAGSKEVGFGPVGVGFDFATGDRLASYHLYSTEEYPFSALPSDEKDNIELRMMTSSEDYDRIQFKALAEKSCVLQKWASIDKRISKYLSLHRAIDAEWNTGRISTHVAGLIAGGEPEIGIIPYRTWPYSLDLKEKKDENLGKSAARSEIFKKMLEDLERPVYESKVKIVFLGDPQVLDNVDKAQSEPGRQAYDKFKINRRIYADFFEAEIKAHPEILFVTYPVSAPTWSDNFAHIQFPCGLEVSNLLCVGYLDEDDNIGAMQDIPLNKGANLIFEKPMSKKTTEVSDQCEEAKDLLADAISGSSPNGQICKHEIKSNQWTGKWIPSTNLTRAQSQTLQSVLSACADPKRLLTSVDNISEEVRAAAEVTRLAARYWAEHPEIRTGAEIVAQLKSQASCVSGKSGALGQICKISVPAIDWKKAEK